MAAPTVTYDKSLAQLSGSVLQAIRVYILQAIVNGETVVTSAQDLLTAAKCYIACIPEGVLAAIEVYLLTQIANGGAGSGGGVLNGIIDPVAAPSGDAALYYNTNTGTLWAWNPTTVAWNQLL